MHTLYCTPLGETKRDEFIQKMIEVLAAGRGRDQAYLLPSAYLINAARQMIMAGGLPGYELPQLFSFDDLAQEIAYTAGCAHKLMNRITQEMLVEEVVNKLINAGKLPYFSSIAAFPGFISTITSLLAEIKGSGTSPAEFANAANIRNRLKKDQEISSVYITYQSFLSELQLADPEEYYFLAVDALREGKAVLPYTHLYISEFYIFSPLQLELIKELRRFIPIEISLIYEKQRAELFAAVEPTYAALTGMGFEPRFVQRQRQTSTEFIHIRNHLFKADAETMIQPAEVEVINCRGNSQEMAVVAAKIKELLLQGDCQPNNIAVVARDLTVYEGFRQIAAEYNIPVSSAWEENLTDQPLFQLLEAAFTAKLENGSRQSVLNLIKSPFLSDLLTDADKLEYESAKVFIRSWLDWHKIWSKEERKNNGFTKLRRIISSMPKNGFPDELAAAVRNLVNSLNVASWIGSRYHAQQMSLPLLKGVLLTYDKVIGPEGILEQIVRGIDLLGNSDRRWSLKEFWQIIRRVAASEKLKLEDYNEQGVQVVSPLGVRGTTFKAVFILGLTEGQFPLRSRENWLYDDQERALLGALGIALKTTALRRKEEDLYFAVAVALAEEKLTVSFSEDAETMPSTYVGELLRLFATDAVKTEIYNVSDLFPTNYSRIYSAEGLTGRVLVDTFSGADDCFSAVAGYVAENLTDSDLKRRVEAELERSSKGKSLFSGHIGAFALPDFPAFFSISALEDYARCPFSYYVKRVLKLEEWEEKEEEAGLDIIGSFYHEVLAAFLRLHTGEILKPECEVDYQAELLAAAAVVLDRLAAERVVVNGKFWDYQRRRLEQVLCRWLKNEIEEQNSSELKLRPFYFEWGFGLPVKEDMDKASVASPLELQTPSGVIHIVGKIDRIDAVGDKMAVIDYKRKASPSFRQLTQGIDLQAALYIMAVEQLLCLRGIVIGGGYYSVEGLKKEGGMWRAEMADVIRHRSNKRDGNLSEMDWNEVQNMVRNYVGQYVEGIRAGHFPIAPAAECPPYCPGREICRYHVQESTMQSAGGENDG